MNKIFKTRSIKPMLVSLSIVGLSCLILSLIVFNGKYFQNRINCEYSPHKQIFLTCWFLLFAYFAVCLFCLIKTNSEIHILFSLGMQSFTFAVCNDNRLPLCGLRYDNGQRQIVSIFFAVRRLRLFWKKQFSRCRWYCFPRLCIFTACSEVICCSPKHWIGKIKTPYFTRNTTFIFPCDTPPPQRSEIRRLHA